ncbi:MAG: phenylacetate--CoA ligase family protein [candidate division WOR-3 bacterium]|nr:MAG: phenylacetate--CoA ligase family protein [candidate division WOR-3 bacterium]
MSKEAFANNVALRVIDKCSGLRVRKYHRLYRAALNWRRQRIEAYQLERMRALLRHAYDNVPFYHARFVRSRLTPDSFNSFKDLRRLPLLTRTDLRDSLDDLLAEDFRAFGASQHTSSGTTGIPITYYKDTNARSADIAATYFMWNLSGCSVGEKRFHVWGTPDSAAQWHRLGSRLKRKLLNAKYFPAGSLDDDRSYQSAVRMINSYKPELIDGYTSSIYTIAKYALDRNIKMHRPKKVLTTAENLYTYQREIIEGVLGPVRDVYGCGEINGVAVECLEKNYHIIEPRVYVEYEDSISGNSTKRIVLTDLENYAMPFIRYEVGDMFDGIDHTQQCKCGLESPYFREIVGRTSELIKLPNGMVISPVTVFGGAAFRKVHNFNKHQTIWNGKYLIFVFEVTDSFTQEDKSELESIIRALLRRYSVGYRLRITEKIESRSSKFQYFKNDYDAN